MEARANSRRVQAWKANLAVLTATTPSVFTTPSGATVVGETMTVGTWKLTEIGGGANQPTSPVRRKQTRILRWHSPPRTTRQWEPR